MATARKARPTYFKDAAAFRAWLMAHAADADELEVGFRKVGSGKASVSWPEAVDEALCFGWIDGVHKALDAHSFVVRFSPRKLKSHWSEVNLKRAAELQAEGRMQPAGLAALRRREARPGAKVAG